MSFAREAGRAIRSTLEGVGKGLDPEFNFMEVAQDHA